MASIMANGRGKAGAGLDQTPIAGQLHLVQLHLVASRLTAIVVARREQLLLAFVGLHLLILAAAAVARLAPLGEDVDASLSQVELGLLLLSAGMMFACLLAYVEVHRRQSVDLARVMAASLRAEEPRQSALPPLPVVDADARQDCAKLMARISHELRTPLNAVIGFADLMHRELFGPLGHARYREYAGDIRESGADLLKAAEDIIALTSLAARSSEIRPAPVAMAALVREAAFAHAGEARAKRIGLDMTAIGERVLWGDRQTLQQAVLNLLGAAVRRAPDGAAVVVRMAGTPAQPRLDVAVVPPLGYLVARLPADDDIPDLEIAIAASLVRLQGGRIMTNWGPDGGWQARLSLPGGGGMAA